MKIVLTPDWFLGGDIFIEIFSFIILFLFFYFAIKNYKLSKNKKSLFLGIGFLLIAIAELSTILTKLVLYYDTTLTQNIGRAIITYRIVQSVDIFYYLGFFFHKLFTLLGFYIIYRLPLRKKSAGDFLLAIYIIIVSALFGQAVYYLFHLTAITLLILIINNYYKIYEKNKSANTKILMIAFIMLALSQSIFVLSKISALYATAQVVQLASYLMLLLLIIRIFKHGKEKKPNRHNF